MVKKKAKINRMKRRFLHAVWPKLVMGPLYGTNAELGYLLRTNKDGLTPGERQVVEKQMAEISLAVNNLQRIYYRLKF